MIDIITKENALLSEKYHKFKHKSGLDVYVIPKKMTTSYAIFATRYGAIDNKFKHASDEEYTVVPDGIAHFLEHKLFECEDGTDAFELFAKTGASANAFTTNTMTAYIFSCTDNFYESLEILLNFVTHPYFSKATVEKEQGIIGQEIRMYDDHPGARLNRSLFSALYEKNKMNIDVAGTIESISQITPELLYKCHEIFYNLNNMALCVCGDIDTRLVEKVCDKVLVEIAPPFDVIRDTEDEDEPKEVFKKREACYLDVAKPIFAIGIKDLNISSDPDVRTKKSFGIEILNEMLFSQSTKFYNDLYDKNLIAQALVASGGHSKYCSFNTISSEASDPEKIYKLFVEYIEKTKKEGLSKEDFELSKRTVLASNIKNYDSVENIGDNFIFTLFDDSDLLDETEIISSITFEYIEELFYEIYREEYYTMAVVYPQEEE